MSKLPENLKYVKSHEWVRDEGDGVVAIGITDHAQELLGDLVFVELPEVGADLERDADCAVVESVKAASDVYSPLAGEVIEVNEQLVDSPEIINDDPYEAGWIYKLRLADSDELQDLMDAAGYAEYLEADED